MIDCTNTEEYFAEKRRMTKRTSDGTCKIECSDCPLSGLTNKTPECMTCVTFEMYHPEKAIAVIQKWSDEHPPKTYLSEFLEHYPNAQLSDKGLPMICSHLLGLMRRDDCKANCIECWGQTIEDGENK